MTSFTWAGGNDINGANNWITPGNWRVAGVPATTFPSSAADDVTVNADVGASDAIISNGQAITVGSMVIGNTPGAPGGHVIVGGGPAIGGGGGGALTSIGPITVSSTNSGGGLVGGPGGVITAPSLSISGPTAVVGGGGSFNFTTILNEGEIQADGGDFNLGGLILNAATITGPGFIEVDGPSTVEINAPTSENVRVSTDPGQTGSIVFDQPGAFGGTLSFLTRNTAAVLLFKGETITGASYNDAAHTIVVTGAGGAVINTIPFVGDGTVIFAVVPSALPGYGEITMTPTNTGILPQIPAPVNGISSTTFSSNDLSQLLQGNQSAMRFVSGTEAITLVDGTLSVGPDTNQAFLTRLYESLLRRGPDLNGISGWNASLNAGTSQSAIAQAFVNSTEFQTANPNQDNTGFITALYKSFLGRAPDAAGLSGWNALLTAGASKGDVTVAFANSAEAKQVWSGVTSLGVFAYNPNSAIVRSEYLTGLSRDADTGGLAAWTNLLNSGASPTQLGEDLAASPEFQTLHGAQSNTDFINSLYQAGLGRAADAGGLAYWTGALQSGTNRGDLLASIANTPEALGHVQWALTA